MVCHRARSSCPPVLLPTWLPLSLCSRISYLFIDGACSASSNKRWSFQLDSCALQAFKASGNDSSCEAAVHHGRPSFWFGSPSWWSTVQPNAPGGSGRAETSCVVLDFTSTYPHETCNIDGPAGKG